MRGFHPEGNAAQLQVFKDRELAKQIATLRNKGNAFGQQIFLTGAVDVFTIQQHFALTWFK